MSYGMKYPTKQKRLIAITDAYTIVTGNSTFTTTEVADWAIANNLWPVPRRGDPVGLCLLWETGLDEFVKTASPARPADGEKERGK